ncbi:MAG: hypothetical protein ACI8PB_003880 [Desulforhopalus sp.]|jgi:hypothetical protein
MQIPGTSNSALSAALPILKSANQQPRLAGDLIAKTVAGMSQMQTAQTPAQSIDMSRSTGTGKIINITA